MASVPAIDMRDVADRRVLAEHPAIFRKVLVANRGEIAARIVRTLRRMGIASVAVCWQADRFTRPVLGADEHVVIGPAPAADGYLDQDAILAACRAIGAEAVHPGYGFLSERAGFAGRLTAEGIGFIGPSAANIRDFGLKHTARALPQAAGVPLLPTSSPRPTSGRYSVRRTRCTSTRPAPASG